MDTKKCEHHGEDLVLYCPVCRPGHEELQQRIEELDREISRYQATAIHQSERIAELSNDLKSYAAMHIEQESEIGRLDAALAEVRDMHHYRISGDDAMEIIEIIDKARAGE